MSCGSCLDDITDQNKVLFKQNESSDWQNFGYCSECVKELMKFKWNNYITSLKKTDCQKTLKLLIKKGPPHNFRDVGVTNDEEIFQFHYEGQIQTAKLENSLDQETNRMLHLELLPIIDAIDGTLMGDALEFDYIARINNILGKFGL